MSAQNFDYFDTEREVYWGINKNSWGGLFGGGILKFSIKISDNLYQGKVNYVSRTSDKYTRNFKVQIELSNKKNDIISGLSSEIQIGTKNLIIY